MRAIYITCTLLLLVLLAGCGKAITGKPIGASTGAATVQPVSTAKTSASAAAAPTTATPAATTSQLSTSSPPATDAAPTPSTTTTSDGSTCTDGDGGPDTKVKGKTTAGSESKTDECNDVFLTEYYCGSDGIEQINKKCSDSCENGACV